MQSARAGLRCLRIAALARRSSSYLGAERCRHTNRPVLVAAPLAVAAQIVREAAKFDIEASRSSDGSVASKIVFHELMSVWLHSTGHFAGVRL